jgi:hypothetical protein
MSFWRTALATYLRLACLVIGMGSLSGAAYSLWLASQWRSDWDTIASLAVILAIALLGVGAFFLRLAIKQPWVDGGELKAGRRQK